eukprot:TRINITY_DN7542_c0_g1_i2.p1 TRINITY_DN7542_c0_g1~~TRINITY_DN7542_c0_g1_i2.p1  ORF type:complete len:115 (-),score=12.13 TRINITY_DN7542_c0_g1_i2:380-724(-)
MIVWNSKSNFVCVCVCCGGGWGFQLKINSHGYGAHLLSKQNSKLIHMDMVPICYPSKTNFERKNLCGFYLINNELKASKELVNIPVKRTCEHSSGPCLKRRRSKVDNFFSVASA